MESLAQLNVYANRRELSVGLAVYVARLGSGASAKRGRFCVALSGGSLMDIIGPCLGATPLRDTIDWASWHVFWSDERWVPKDSPESNYHHANRHIFTRVGIPAGQIHAADDSLGPDETAEVYSATMAEVLQPEPGRLPRFDLVLLGIGEDGHTASLFPNHKALRETRCWVVSVMDAPKPPPIRITMTLPVINNARHVLFVAAGNTKARIVSKVFNPDGEESALPAHLVAPSNGELRWFLDGAAAAELF